MLEPLTIATPVGVFDAIAAGPPDGRAVLLLHGFPQGAVEWEAQLADLAEAGCRAVAVEQRGYSAGVRPGEISGYRMDELVADALRVADTLGWPVFDLVGHDWGAAIGWVLADRHPDRLRSFTAVSIPHPQPFADALRDDEDQRRRSAYLGMFREPGQAEGFMLGNGAAGLRQMLARGVPHDKIESYVTRMAEPGAMTAALNWYRATPPETVRAGRITVPTLYVWGTEDVGVGRVAAANTAAWVDAPYRFAPFGGVSHWVPEEAPTRLSEEILAHLAVQAVQAAPAAAPAHLAAQKEAP